MAKLPYFAQVLNNTGHVSEVWKNYFLSLDGGGGGGGVESVQGTANRITVTGTTNPVVNIASNYAGQTSINTLGTVIAGTWQATPVGAAYGGTGQSSYTLGDTLYASGATALSRLAGNTATQRRFLSQTGTGSASAAPAWNALSDSDIPSGIVRDTRTVSTTLPLTGGGDLSANRTLGIGGLSGYGTAGQLLAVNGAATGLEYVNPPSPLSAANPTAQVGLTAVNGVATTYMRSDAAPALSQAITPTWTGAHAFSNTVTMASTLQVSGLSTLAGNAIVGGTGTPSRELQVTGSGGEIGIRINAADGSTPVLELTDGNSTTSGEWWQVFKENTNHSLVFYNGANRFSVSAAGLVSIPGAATITGTTTLSSLSGTFTRLVLANASGVLSANNALSFNAGHFDVTGSAAITSYLSVSGTFYTNAGMEFLALAGGGTQMLTVDNAGAVGVAPIPVGTITGSASANQVAVFSSASAIGGSANFTFSGGTLALTGAQTISSTLGVTGNLTNTVLAGTGTRLVTSTSTGLLGNATTIAGNYTFSGTLAASNLSGTNTGDQTITLTGDVTGSGTGSFAATIANNAVSNAKLRDSAALSVIGRSANSSGDPADIAAGTDAHVLRRSGTTLGFGTIGDASITDLDFNKLTGVPGSFSGFANPTATIGLSAVNGSATTAMRSDAAPALSQSITPTWTGAHVFSNTVSMSSTLTLSGDMILTPSAGLIRSNTADASDNKSVSVAGGGAVGNTRGASITAHGNEFATFGGQLHLNGGAVSTGGIIFTTNGSLRYTLSNAGLHSFATAVSMSSTLQVLGDTILGGSGTPGRALEITGAAGEEGIRINPADGGTPVLEFMDGGSTVAGEYWTLYKNNVSHDLIFYNGANRFSISAAGLVSIPGDANITGDTTLSGNADIGGDATITGTVTLDTLAGTINRVMLADAAGEVFVDNALGFNAGLLDLTGNMQMSGDLVVGGEVAANGGIVLGAGTDVLDVYDEDTFTFTATGLTTSPTGTGRYVRLGNIVVLTLPVISGTSNATAFTFTGLPAAVQPARTKLLQLSCVQDNGTVFADGRGTAEITSGSGTITFKLSGSASGWTSSGAKSIPETQDITYSLT